MGVIVWLATSMRLIDAVVYVYSGLGALLLLVGGVRGSGYGRSGGGSERQSPAEAAPVKDRLARVHRSGQDGRRGAIPWSAGADA